MAVRRHRIDATFRDDALEDLARLQVQVDPDPHRFGWSDTLKLTDERVLSVYDATCLELARRLSLPLATLDQKLRTDT